VNGYELGARVIDTIFSAIFVDVKVVILGVLYEPGFWSSNCNLFTWESSIVEAFV